MSNDPIERQAFHTISLSRVFLHNCPPDSRERRTLFVLVDSEFICFVISPLGPATKLSKLPNSVKIFAVVPTILQSHIGL